MQANDSIMCGYFCIWSFDFMLEAKSLLEKPKISYLLEKTLVLSISCSKCKNEDEKLFKKEESMEILKILGLI